METLSYHQNHGSLQVSITHSLSQKSLHANFHVIACKADVGGVLGVKDSMIAHILGKNGNNSCPNVSEDAQKTVRTEMKGKKKKREREGEGSGSENDEKK